jgi:hypothetical protein
VSGLWLAPALAALLIAGPAAAQEPAVATSAARPADIASPDAIIAALYDVISGPAGATRDWARFRSLFAPGGRLIMIEPAADGAPRQARVLSPDDFVAMATPVLAGEGFFERETARRSERYGAMLHAWSTYASRHAERDAKPFEEGVNSIQLFHDGRRWWVLSLTWPAEPPGSLPEEYRRSR